MTYFELDEQTFFDGVNKALDTVKQILHVHRNPRAAHHVVDHEYSDKYHLANLMTNVNIIAQMNTLQQMGLTTDILKRLDRDKETTLRFQAMETCEFLKQVVVEIPYDRTVETREHTKTNSSFFGGRANTKKATITRMVNRIKEFHWKVGIEWEISLYSGTNINEKIVLQSKKSSTIMIIQCTKHQPIPKIREHPPLEVPLTWLLRQIDTESFVAKFKIDTTSPNTKTPLRNEEVKNAIKFSDKMCDWSTGVSDYFCRMLQCNILERHDPAKGPPAVRMTKLGSDLWYGIFNPVLPLMEEETQRREEENGGDTPTDTAVQHTIFALCDADENDRDKSSLVLSKTDMTKIINEHLRSLEEKIQSLKKLFPHEHLSTEPMSVMEATIYLLCNHSGVLHGAYADSMEYIEWMLEKQLIAAIGKRVDSADMDKFVRFHNNKLLGVAPKPFCHSIRRPNHYPEGVLTIEAKAEQNGSSKTDPIDTFVREVQMSSPLNVPLNAATTLELTGKTFLHGWLQHRFQQSSRSHRLIARARQFSSFMLVVGTMAGPNKLDPKDAIILQNKDEVIIPLLLEELPSAKEFKDAIQSLSPEQQRFAKSFRNMQLESSVLGICIIQIKPQLEALLNLPEDALTKEMKLTQDLMELFVEYQIPSDLLSYDDDAEGGETSTRDMVEAVKHNAGATMDVVEAAKNKQLEEESKKAAMAVSSDWAKEFCIDSAPSAYIHAVPKRSKDNFNSNTGDRRMRARSVDRGRESQRDSRSARYTPPTMLDQADVKMDRVVQKSEVIEWQQGLRQDKISDAYEGTRQDSNVTSQLDAGSNNQTTPKNGNTNGQDTEKSDDLQPRKQNNEIDFTIIPKLLDSLVEKYNKDGSLRSTTIKTGDSWRRKRQKDLLSKATTQTLGTNDIKSEKNKAFDLLDALSRSGSLPIACSELHVIICLTHRFDKTVMGTVIQDNINPIEKLEMSTLLFASAIHNTTPKELIREAQDVDRLSSFFPMLTY